MQEDVDVVVHLDDVLAFMEKMPKHRCAFDAMKGAIAINNMSFAVVMCKARKCIDAWAFPTCGSEEEAMVERDLECVDGNMKRDAKCIGKAWCIEHSQEKLYQMALEAFADYATAYIEEQCASACIEKQRKGANGH